MTRQNATHDAHLAAAAAEVDRVRPVYEQALRDREAAIVAATEAGMSRRQVARVAGVTPGRVQQILTAQG